MVTWKIDKLNVCFDYLDYITWVPGTNQSSVQSTNKLITEITIIVISVTNLFVESSVGSYTWEGKSNLDREIIENKSLIHLNIY